MLQAIGSLRDTADRRRGLILLREFISSWKQLRVTFVTYALDCHSEEIPDLTHDGVKLYQLLPAEDARTPDAITFMLTSRLLPLQRDFLQSDFVTSVRAVNGHAGSGAGAVATGSGMNPWSSLLPEQPRHMLLHEMPVWDDATAQCVCLAFPSTFSGLLSVVSSHYHAQDIVCTTASGAGISNSAASAASAASGEASLAIGAARAGYVDVIAACRALIPCFSSACVLEFRAQWTAFRFRQVEALTVSTSAASGVSIHEHHDRVPVDSVVSLSAQGPVIGQAVTRRWQCPSTGGVQVVVFSHQLATGLAPCAI